MKISAKNLKKHYGEFAALDNVSLTIEEGSLTALIGPSGSGKSTLLRAIAGLDQPDSGQIIIDGQDVTNVTPQERGIGFVFQHYAAFRNMNVRENVGFGLKIRKRPAKEIKQKVDELLEIVGLTGFQHRYPSQLSGGQRQRLALARALAVNPKVLLLDEPFGALDAKVREDLRAWLRNMHEEFEITTVLVTHDQQEALDVADKLVVLNKGRIEQVGTPTQLYDQPANDFVLSFLGQVSVFAGKKVRPHDIRLGHSPALAVESHEVAQTSVVPVVVDRVTFLGFEVRVECHELSNGNPFTAEITRGDALALSLNPGDQIYARATRPAALQEWLGL